MPRPTLHKLKDELASRGVVVSHNAVWTFRRREVLSFKRSHCSLLSRPGSTWPAAGDTGRPCRPGSIRDAKFRRR